MSRVKRDRYCWMNVGLSSGPGVAVYPGGKYDWIVVSAPKEPLHLVVDQGWGWPAGKAVGIYACRLSLEQSPGRSHRHSPQACRTASTRPWRGGGSMACGSRPKHTRHRICLRRLSWELSFVASGCERELLHGCEPGRTARMHAGLKTKVSASAQEDMKMFAIGSTFHTCGAGAGRVTQDHGCRVLVTGGRRIGLLTGAGSLTWKGERGSGAAGYDAWEYIGGDRRWREGCPPQS